MATAQHTGSIDPERRIARLDRASDTDASSDEWIEAMRRGDFERAWQISDLILRRRVAGETCWHWPRHLQFVWTGASLVGKRVLVRCYHGLGDTIQFIRFAAPLRVLAREVIVWAQPELVPLIKTAPGVDQAVPLHDGAPEVGFEVDIESMELPHALRTTLQTLPRNIPYLFAPARCLSRPDSGARLVGIVWHTSNWDARRRLPLALLNGLAAVPRVKLLSLQCGPARGEAAIIPADDISCENVTEAAARIGGLDLVISVDTMVAHLAGALGIPTWTLLQADCDWRWMTGRSDSPWYPTMRLFRQRRAGDWESVIDEVEAALALWSAPRS